MDNYFAVINISVSFAFRASTQDYKYDKYDNCIEVKEIQHDGSVSITTFQLQYDKQNNWIKKEECGDGVLKDTQIRDIIYFKAIQRN